VLSESPVLAELAPVAERLFERHVSTAKEWFPHELVPWSRGRDYVPDEVWHEDEYALPDAVRSALYVNLLTEDNLPYYFHSISMLFGEDDPWGAWARRWTAEEGRHSIVIRDYLTVTRMLDPVWLERGRMHQMSTGYDDSTLPTSIDGLVYVALQELATRVSHRNTGKLLDDPCAYEIMSRVAADENLHYLFYKDIVNAALEVDPSATVCAIDRQVRTFEMPGTGICDFQRHALAIARAGIYDYSLHHDQVLVPVVLRQWGLESVEGLDAEAEKARERALRHMRRLRRAADRFVENRARDTVSA
jgi:acyl-[acyl-carrier-protein] desaturase